MRHGENDQVAALLATSFSQHFHDGRTARNRLAQFIPPFDQAELEQLPNDAVDLRQQMVIQFELHRHRVAVDIGRTCEAKQFRLRNDWAVLGMQS